VGCSSICTVAQGKLIASLIAAPRRFRTGIRCQSEGAPASPRRENAGVSYSVAGRDTARKRPTVMHPEAGPPERGETVIDGSNSRVRFGVRRSARKFLFDLPNYFPSACTARRCQAFSDFSLRFKTAIGVLYRVISNYPATVGLELPTGNARIAGPGYGAYVQFPWSKEIGKGWGLSGMFTAFLMPGEPAEHFRPLEPTFLCRAAKLDSRGRFLSWNMSPIIRVADSPAKSSSTPGGRLSE